jgi:5-methylcytosine-specific restriction protein A
MPQKPLSYCTAPRCKNKTASGRCRSCGSETERERGSAAKRGYDREWLKIRDAYLYRHPVCERDLCNELATDVHHRDGAGPRGDNSDDNLEALCHSHHSQITAREYRFGQKKAGAGT